MINQASKSLQNRFLDDIESFTELCERASSQRSKYAEYLLGLVYKKCNIYEMFKEERKNKARELIKMTAQDGDPYTQFKYGIHLEKRKANDENGFDCVYYFRQSAYHRCKEGIKKYCQCIEGDRKEFYMSLARNLPDLEMRFTLIFEEIFFDEMMSCYIGSLLHGAASRKRFKDLYNMFSGLALDKLH